MARYAALLASVNVGGNRIKMEALRKALAACGFENVETVMASGNVLFDHPRGTDSALQRAIADCVEKAFGFRTFAAVRSKAELQAAIDDNPFAGKHEDRFVHSYFLDSAVSEREFKMLEDNHKGPEAIAWGGREIYIHYVEGAGRSKLTGAFIDKRLGRRGTARNMRSLAKIIDRF